MIPDNDFKTLNEAEKSETFFTEKQLRYHINAIRNVIRGEEKRIRTANPWLAYQNVIGLSIFLGSLLACFTTAFFYMRGSLPFYLAIPMVAIAISLLHELEHDLIHNLYFKGQAWVQHIMFFAIWMSKFSINPWYRKVLHLRHHIMSGQVEDMEERFVGLGMPLGWLRLLIQLYPFSNLLIFPKIHKDNKREFGFDMMLLVILMNTPGIVAYTIAFHLFVGFARLNLGLVFGPYDPVLAYASYTWLSPYVTTVAVLIVLPNMLRQFSLNVLASYCHYYGDIPRYNVFYQNQVLNSWIVFPFQLFGFNFGATHIIHHFVTNQPFYLRQWLAPKATKELIKHGIRENDFDIVRRNNRYFNNIEEIKKGA